MSVLDRLVRETRRELDPMEGLVGCVEGREEGGRRRVVVIATDRRILMVMPRRDPPRRFDYDELSEVTRSDGPEGAGLRLVTTDGQAHAVDRITDPRALELLVELVTARCEVAARARPTEPAPRVRIIG